MTQRCQDILERLVEGVTGSVPPAERAVVVEHLATCADCRREAEAIEAIAARARDAGTFAVPPNFWAEFMGNLNDRLTVERMPVWMRIRRALATPRYAWGTAVATAAVIFAISTTAVRLGPRPTIEPTAVPPNARGIVTEAMTTTLPSLGTIIDVWRAGLAESESGVSASEQRP